MISLPGFSQKENSFGIEMVEIPPGSFYMGSQGFGEDYDESPAHEVIISHSFTMSATEITNAQYECFDPSHKKLRNKENGFSLNDNDPVVFVNYQDALAFCEWLSKKRGKPIGFQQRQNGNMLAAPERSPLFLPEMI